MTKYKKIGDTGLYAECKRCGVYIPKGSMKNHWKTDCDGEEGKRERDEINKKVLGVMNKVMEELGW